jgi:hypothetical protein
MRDPKRIDEMLSALRAAWLESPDLRLAQLVVIAAKPPEPCPQVFYVEDDALMLGLARYRDQVAAVRASDSGERR